MVPAVSSVAQAFARAGMPWDDAQVVVAHRRTLRRAVNVCRAHTKVAVLTSPGAGPAELGLLLDGVHRTFVICEELGTEREQVTVLTSDKAADHTWRDPNVVIVIGGTGRRRPTPAGSRDATRAPARAAGRCPPRPTAATPSSARARPTGCAPPNSPASARAWATSSGTSAAAAAPSPWRRPAFGAAVIAVDRDPDACARTTAAARRFGVQPQIVHGDGPARPRRPARARCRTGRGRGSRGGLRRRRPPPGSAS